jgi:hypothetical protein
VDGKAVLDQPMVELRDVWERTSDELELLQVTATIDYTHIYITPRHTIMSGVRCTLP